jgi:hypothetical protein
MSEEFSGGLNGGGVSAGQERHTVPEECSGVVPAADALGLWNNSLCIPTERERCTNAGELAKRGRRLQIANLNVSLGGTGVAG